MGRHMHPLPTLTILTDQVTHMGNFCTLLIFKDDKEFKKVTKPVY